MLGNRPANTRLVRCESTRHTFDATTNPKGCPQCIAEVKARIDERERARFGIR